MAERDAATSLMDLATGYWRSAALSAAIDLDLFAPIEQAGAEGISAADVAAACETDPTHTAALLDALVALELLNKTDQRYTFTESAAPLLRRDSERCLLDALRFNIDLYPLWGRLAECVQSGTPVIPPADHLGDDPARTRRFVRGMHSRAEALAPAILPHLDMTGVNHLLDVGSGPGTFSRRLAERHPHLHVTQLDLPRVLAGARELTAETASAAAPRIDFLEADYHRYDFSDLADRFDAVLYFGALHQESPDTAGGLLEQLVRPLKPAGRLLVVDLMLNADRTAPPFSTLFDLNMKLINQQARVFAVDEVRQLLAEAPGLVESEVTDLPETPYTMVTARKDA